MATEKEQLYRKELEEQLKHSGESKEIYSFLHEVYRRGFIAKYLQGGLALLIEVILYGAFVLSFGAAVYLVITNKISITLFSTDDAELKATIKTQEIQTFVTVLHIGLFLFSFFWLFLGRMFGAIRKKNEIIDELTDHIEQIKEVEDERLQRIQNVLK